MSLWAEPSGAAGAFGPERKGRAHLDAVESVRERTRERFKLADDEVVLVTEVARTLPGCPPLETVVAFWTADGTRHHYKVFKPVEAVGDDDIPPAWLKGSLALVEGVECACC